MILCGECKCWADIYKGQDGRKIGTCSKTGQKHYRVHKCSIGGNLDDINKVIAARRITRDQATRIIEYYNAGFTYEKIAGYMACSKPTIYRIIRDLRREKVIQ